MDKDKASVSSTGDRAFDFLQGQARGRPGAGQRQALLFLERGIRRENEKISSGSTPAIKR